MGSRQLPTDCPHGVTIDWGDFGPCQDCAEHDFTDCPNLANCQQCAAQRIAAVRQIEERAQAFFEAIEHGKTTGDWKPYDDICGPIVTADEALAQMRTIIDEKRRT